MSSTEGEILRKISSLLGNGQRLDGGAMFGNAPRALWSRWIEPDEAHRIPLACRALLIEEEHPSGARRRILCEAGIGVFFPPKLRERFGIESAEHELLNSLAARGLSAEDIDVVVLSHLHFDHVGGLLTPWREGEAPQLCFPDAHYVIGAEAWARAQNPHPRDRASFIPELNALLEAGGRVELISGASGTTLRSETLGAGYCFHQSNGHTPGQLLIEVASEEGPVVFCGDLIPGSPWVHLPITMGYDRNPELLIDEKARFYEELLPRGVRLFFTHDPHYAIARLNIDERGRYRAEELQEELDRVAI